MEESQAQCVHYHEKAAQAHRRRPKHRAQLPVECRIEHTCSQRNSTCIIEERPEQVFLDVADHRFAQADRCHHIQQVIFHQHHVRALDRHVRSRSDGDSHIGPCQCRRIVHAVSDHRNLSSFTLKSCNFPLFILGKHLGNDCIDPKLSLDGCRCSFIVSGQHNDLDAQLLQLPDRLGAGRFHNIRRANDSDDAFLIRKQQRGFSFLCQLIHLFLGFPAVHTLVFHQADISGIIPSAADFCLDSLARDCLKFLGFQQADLLFFRLLHDSFRQRMLAFRLHRRRNFQQLTFCHRTRGNQIRHHRFSLCDRTCFVQDDALNIMCYLQRFAGFDQNTILRSFSGTNHDRHRRRKSQRTRTGDHQNADRTGKGKFKLSARGQPRDRCDQRDRHNDRNKNSCNLVGNLGDRSLACACIFHQTDDL